MFNTEILLAISVLLLVSYTSLLERRNKKDRIMSNKAFDALYDEINAIESKEEMQKIIQKHKKLHNERKKEFRIRYALQKIKNKRRTENEAITTD